MTIRTLALALLVPVLTACTEETTTVLAPALSTLTPTAANAIDSALQDEYHAEQTYLRVLADHGNILPFFNVVVAEERHSASLSLLLERRSLDVPESEWDLANVPRFATVAAACAAAAEAEIANIAMYDRLLTVELPPDVRNVFTNNRRASLERHLPAFTACR